MQVTTRDLQRLTQNPSGAERGILAMKVASAFSAGEFSARESQVAAEIFRLLLKDAEKAVRETLAEHLYNIPSAPHDVVFRLACDEADIANKILQHSVVLTEEDLVALVRSAEDVLKLCAIAKREHVSERVAGSLLETRQEAALGALFANKGAALSEKTLLGAWDMFSSHQSLLQALIKRGGLPLTVAEKIYLSVSDEWKQHVAREYQFASPLMQKAAADAREWELLGIMPMGDILHPDDDERVEELVDRLYVGGRLTHSLIIRALCMGCLNLFEVGIARMASVPRVNARILLMGGDSAFHALYRAARLPEAFMDAVEKLLEISLAISEYGYARPEDFRKRVIENIYIEQYHRSVDGMAYLLAIIGGKMASPVPEVLH